ncbi:MAG: hypothetical protein R3B09_30955 [Nannocystaceae bacterium]
MAKLQAKLVSVALAGACALGAWKLGSAIFSSDVEGAGTENLVNQVWLERIPRDDRDIITHFLLLDTDDGRFGVLGHSSTWRHRIEVFKWNLEEDRLALFFPQDRNRSQLKARTWRCGGEAPKPFDLCLELSRGERSALFYSHHDWVIEGAVDEAKVRELFADTPALQPLAGPLSDAPTAAAAPVSDEDAVELGEDADLLGL